MFPTTNFALFSFSGDKLHAALEKQFLEAFETDNTDILKRCLRIYATVDRIQDAEDLLKKNIIEPYLEEIINPDRLHSEPTGLHGICTKILEIIPTKLQLILKLSKSNRKQEKNYDFIGKSLWPVVVDRFECQFGSTIFSGALNCLKKFREIDFTIFSPFFSWKSGLIPQELPYHHGFSNQTRRPRSFN